MQMQIERFDVDEPHLSQLVSDRVRHEIPFVVTRIQACDRGRITPAYIKARFSSESCRRIGWYDSALVDDDVIRTPAIVAQTLRSSEMSSRGMPMRVFMQPRGHTTLPHYDGNSLHGMNLQVLGRKRWILTSPRTPLPTMPFMFAGMVRREFVYDPRKYHYLEFETGPDDLLFLPRYWYHEVHALEEVNLNINWVFTPALPNERNPVGQREVELLKLRQMSRLIDRAFPNRLSEYGGRGPELTNRYTAKVGAARALTRLVKEVVKYPQLFAVARDLNARTEEFARNNFNV